MLDTLVPMLRLPATYSSPLESSLCVDGILKVGRSVEVSV